MGELKATKKKSALSVDSSGAQDEKKRSASSSVPSVADIPMPGSGKDEEDEDFEVDLLKNYPRVAKLKSADRYEAISSEDDGFDLSGTDDKESKSRRNSFLSTRKRCLEEEEDNARFKDEEQRDDRRRDDKQRGGSESHDATTEKESMSKENAKEGEDRLDSSIGRDNRSDKLDRDEGKGKRDFRDGRNVNKRDSRDDVERERDIVK